MPARLLALALVLTAGVGCAPSLAPTYRDYRIEAAEPLPWTSPEFAEAEPVEARLRAALAETGWEEVEPDVASVISTAPRDVGEGFFSRTEATLDLVPLNDRFVRVYIHARTYSFLGGRTKAPYLSRGLRSRVLGDLTDALRERGLTALDETRRRDEEATE